jgi:hypothetical protein
MVLLTLPRYISSDIINLFVEPKRKKYHVHKDLICERSEYFQKAFQPITLKESLEGGIYFPEDVPEAFDLFVRWLYTSELDNADSITDEKLLNYAHLYVLADKVCLGQLQNAAIDRNISWAGISFFSPSFIKSVYEMTPQDSVMRALMVDEVISLEENILDAEEAFRSNNDFAGDLICALADEERDRIAPFKQDDACDKYHSHRWIPVCSVDEGEE